MKKYELTNETINFENKKLFRIRALKDFGNVKAGDLGGYVESENNLSQEDNCWIYENAKVYGNAEVSNDDIVSGNARVYDDAMKIKKELNSRQWALYEHLKYLYMLNDSEWHNLKDLCNELKNFKEYHYKETANFNNTSARRILTNDLSVLANSDKVGYCSTWFEVYNYKRNVIYRENSDGYWEKWEYNEKGIVIYRENSKGKIIDERVKELTIEEIEKLLGYKIKIKGERK